MVTKIELVTSSVASQSITASNVETSTSTTTVRTAETSAVTGGTVRIAAAASKPRGPDRGNCGGGNTRRGMIFHPTLGYAIPPPLPLSVARRNARERNRVKTVNTGFECLRLHVPSAARAKKMSKVDILRHSVDYIKTLQKILEDYEEFTASKNVQHVQKQSSNTGIESGRHVEAGGQEGQQLPVGNRQAVDQSASSSSFQPMGELQDQLNVSEESNPGSSFTDNNNSPNLPPRDTVGSTGRLCCLPRRTSTGQTKVNLTSPTSIRGHMPRSSSPSSMFGDCESGYGSPTQSGYGPSQGTNSLFTPPATSSAACPVSPIELPYQQHVTGTSLHQQPSSTSEAASSMNADFASNRNRPAGSLCGGSNGASLAATFARHVSIASGQMPTAPMECNTGNNHSVVSPHSAVVAGPSYQQQMCTFSPSTAPSNFTATIDVTGCMGGEQSPAELVYSNLSSHEGYSPVNLNGGLERPGSTRSEPAYLNHQNRGENNYAELVSPAQSDLAHGCYSQPIHSSPSCAANSQQQHLSHRGQGASLDSTMSPTTGFVDGINNLAHFQTHQPMRSNVNLGTNGLYDTSADLPPLLGAVMGPSGQGTSSRRGVNSSTREEGHDPQLISTLANNIKTSSRLLLQNGCFDMALEEEDDLLDAIAEWQDS